MMALISGCGAKSDAKPVAEQLNPETGHVPGILCWGDSLTNGYLGDGVSYPGRLQELLEENGYGDVDVVNLGSVGETSISITARSGGMPLVLDEEAYIDADWSVDNIVMLSCDGKQVNLSTFHNIGINGCTLSDDKNSIEGELLYNSEGPNGIVYAFCRKTSGEDVYFDAGATINPYYKTNCLDYISIIFMGTNGGYDDAQDLIKQHEAIINSREANQNRFLIIGMLEPQQEIKDAMVKKYGDRYLDFAQYCGGSIPDEWWSDEVHLNADGYNALGEAVYEKLIELNCLGK